LVGVNVWFQRHGYAAPIRVAGFGERLVGAGAVIWFYLGKALWPVRLVFIYPHWRVDARQWLWWVPLAGALATTGLLVGGRRGWPRALLFGWGYYCLALLPVMGFADVYFMKYSLVADHYQHLALIAVAALGGGLWWLAQRRWGRAWPTAALAAALALLTLRTHLQLQNYRDAPTLYRATLALNPDAWTAHYDLGLLLARSGRMEEAAGEFREALRCSPGDYPDAELNLGIVLMQTGDLPGSVPHFEAALRMDPHNADARYDFGMALAKSGRIAEAIAQFDEALRLRPSFPQALNNLGILLAQSGRLEEASQKLEEALRIEPDLAEARRNLQLMLQALGRGDEAQRFSPGAEPAPNDPGQARP
jgi:tetratricopeptide (TPR) repeat protein